MMDFPLEKFVHKTLELLEKEREAEIEETRLLQENVPLKELQRKGVCILKLRLASQHTGLYGRSVLVFEAFWSGKEMPSHSFTSGDIAGLSLSSSEATGEQLASGIVSKVSQSSISVAFEEQHDVFSLDDQSQYKLMKLANNVTHRRLKKALNNLNDGKTRNNLAGVLFGEYELGPPLCSARDGVDADVKFLNPGLDESQREAVQFALNQRELAIIHGPPGTGKTTTVVEIIQQCLSRKLKILACAPSNIAVDNLVERLAVNKARVVRLGHPARLLASIQPYALDALLGASDETKLVRDVRNDMDKALSKLRKTRDKGERQRLRDDMKSLRREYREREKAAVTAILEKADVVLATLTGASEDGPLKHLPKDHFDLVVIDECSQALEAACWIPLTSAPKCVLAGDHNQLPPTILSHKAAKEGLETTLMERLLGLYGNKAMRMLTMQYRMHESIMKWSSDQLYGGKLLAHSSVAAHLLCDLPHVKSNATTSVPLLMIDTAGCSLEELNLAEEFSKGNEGEADIVAYQVDVLVDSGLSAQDIAVIAPYNLQVDLLRLRLSAKHPQLEIKSVDGFQGREKEAVIISLVRSNQRGEVGFLAEDRRINVAVTRARRHLTVVCDSETVSRHAFLGSLVDYITDHGEVRSAQQFIDEGALSLSSDRPEYLDDQMKRPTNRQQSSRAVRPKTNKKTDKKPQNLSQGKQSFEKQRNPEEDLSLKRELERTLTEFFKSSDGVLSFPSTLNSYQRLCIHEIAEKLGLSHVSQGEGEERHIVVSKDSEPKKIEKKTENSEKKSKSAKTSNSDILNKSKRADVVPDEKENKSEDNEEKKEEDDKKSENLLRSCPKCHKEMPISNYDLHILRCESTVSKTTKKNKKKKSAKKESKPEEIEDFDQLVAAAIHENTTCHFTRCKNNAATLGQNCAFCARRFCLTHFVAEMHGCGTKAREKARIQISRDGVLFRGSGVPDKKPSASKRGHLERKLEGKIGDMTDKRKPKKKE